MPYDAVGVAIFMAYGDSNLLERLQPDGARAIRFFFPRGQPCLVCWLVGPPKWREASLPVAVPIPGPALGCFCACALGRHAPRWRRHMTPRATRPRVTPPLTTNLLGPSQTNKPTNKAAGRVTERSKFNSLSLESGLNQRSEATQKASPTQVPVFSSKNTPAGGAKQLAAKIPAGAGPPPCAPANGRPGFPFGFLGAGGRFPKARRGRVFIAEFFFFFFLKS